MFIIHKIRRKQAPSPSAMIWARLRRKCDSHRLLTLTLIGPRKIYFNLIVPIRCECFGRNALNNIWPRAWVWAYGGNQALGGTYYLFCCWWYLTCIRNSSDFVPTNWIKINFTGWNTKQKLIKYLSHVHNLFSFERNGKSVKNVKITHVPDLPWFPVAC